VPFAILAGSCALGAMTGLTVQLPLYYEVVYHLSASEAGLALIPLAAISTCGAALSGKNMARARRYKRVAIIGDIVATISGAALCAVSFAALGHAGAAVDLLLRARHDVPDHGGVDPECGGAAPGRHRHRRHELFPRAGVLVCGRSLHRDLLMALGADISLAGEHRGPVSSISSADMIAAFRWVFGAAAAMMACATLCMIMMEERPLAGPGTRPVEMAE